MSTITETTRAADMQFGLYLRTGVRLNGMAARGNCPLASGRSKGGIAGRCGTLRFTLSSNGQAPRFSFLRGHVWASFSRQQRYGPALRVGQSGVTSGWSRL